MCGGGGPFRPLDLQRRPDSARRFEPEARRKDNVRVNSSFCDTRLCPPTAAARGGVCAHPSPPHAPHIESRAAPHGRARRGGAQAERQHACCSTRVRGTRRAPSPWRHAAYEDDLQAHKHRRRGLRVAGSKYDRPKREPAREGAHAMRRRTSCQNAASEDQLWMPLDQRAPTGRMLHRGARRRVWRSLFSRVFLVQRLTSRAFSPSCQAAACWVPSSYPHPPARSQTAGCTAAASWRGRSASSPSPSSPPSASDHAPCRHVPAIRGPCPAIRKGGRGVSTG